MAAQAPRLLARSPQAPRERPLDSHLLAEKPNAGGAPPGSAILERLANRDQANTTEDGVTLDRGRDKVWQLCTDRDAGDRAPG